LASAKEPNANRPLGRAIFLRIGPSGRPPDEGKEDKGAKEAAAEDEGAKKAAAEEEGAKEAAAAVRSSSSGSAVRFSASAATRRAIRLVGAAIFLGASAFGRLAATAGGGARERRTGEGGQTSISSAPEESQAQEDPY
jgi:membrane protein involved in colicin uptake